MKIEHICYLGLIISMDGEIARDVTDRMKVGFEYLPNWKNFIAQVYSQMMLYERECCEKT